MAHLVWDWNGTLLDDLSLVVAATNVSLATAGGGPVTADEHRRDFRRPIQGYYADVLARTLSPDEFLVLDRAFHEAYQAGLPTVQLSIGALDALRGWPGTQSLLSMWFHEELVPTVARYRLNAFFTRVDGLRAVVGGGHKAPHLEAHLEALGIDGTECVMIGDSVDDAHAAHSVGATCILYAGGFTDRRRLLDVGVPVVDTLAEAVTLAGHTATGYAEPRR